MPAGAVRRMIPIGSRVANNTASRGVLAPVYASAFGACPVPAGGRAISSGMRAGGTPDRFRNRICARRSPATSSVLVCQPQPLSAEYHHVEGDAAIRERLNEAAVQAADAFDALFELHCEN